VAAADIMRACVRRGGTRGRPSVDTGRSAKAAADGALAAIAAAVARGQPESDEHLGMAAAATVSFRWRDYVIAAAARLPCRPHVGSTNSAGYRIGRFAGSSNNCTPRGPRSPWTLPFHPRPLVETRSQRRAVFVDGSFWHGHPSMAAWPLERYWNEKVKRNIDRDARGVHKLGRVRNRADYREFE
jgi:hypothetical protein